jgi:hypothetical protein
MHAVSHSVVMLAIFNSGEGEIILILALVLILFGARKLPPLTRGVGAAFHFSQCATGFHCFVCCSSPGTVVRGSFFWKLQRHIGSRAYSHQAK